MAKKKSDEKKNKTLEDVYLAGLGALKAIEKEGKTFFENLVKEGVEFEKKGKKEISTLLDEFSGKLGDVKKNVKDAAKKAEKKVDKGISSVTDKMDMAKKSDIRELTKKVEELSKKLEKLAGKKKDKKNAKKEKTTSKKTPKTSTSKQVKKAPAVRSNPSATNTNTASMSTEEISPFPDTIKLD